MNLQTVKNSAIVGHFCPYLRYTPYFEQERYDRAQEALEAAVELEDDFRRLGEAYGELRRAQSHYYLAQIYERQDDPAAAQTQWEEALRYLKEDNWADREWLAVVRENLAEP